MYDLPLYVWALVLTGAIGIPAATCAVLYRGAFAAGLGRRAATAVAATTAAMLGGWLVITGSLARAGLYQGQGRAAVAFFAAFAGFLSALLLATRIPLVSRILADPSAAARLALPHTVRVVGVLFLLVIHAPNRQPPGPGHLHEPVEPEGVKGHRPEKAGVAAAPALSGHSLLYQAADPGAR